MNAITALGFHHATAIAGPVQQNVNFYSGILGMRLVKRSVNQDAPNVYHLFYGDAQGTPGTDLTFFPWPQVVRFQAGAGTITQQGLAVPPGSLPYWQQRLQGSGVATESDEWFGQRRLRFHDPDGMALALVEGPEDHPFMPWGKSPVPPEFQIRRLYTTEICVSALEPTEQVLMSILGFRKIAEQGKWHRFAVGTAGEGGFGYLDVQVNPTAPPGRWGRGGMHHVAWRTRDAMHLSALRELLISSGLQPTPIIDRFWFRSVYFREPGGVLFELATDGPGFTADEPLEHLGERLVLPPWLEEQRAAIEAQLPPFEYPPRV